MDTASMLDEAADASSSEPATQSVPCVVEAEAQPRWSMGTARRTAAAWPWGRPRAMGHGGGGQRAMEHGDGEEDGGGLALGTADA